MKRYSLLIELLIAIMLISLCAFPLIDTQVFMYKKSLDSAVEVLQKQQEENAFREIQRELYIKPEDNKMQITWEDFSKMTKWRNKPVPFHKLSVSRTGELEDVTIPLIFDKGKRGVEIKEITFKREYYITSYQGKPADWFFLAYPEKFRLLDVRINVYRSSAKGRQYKDLSEEEKNKLPSFQLLIEKG